MKSIFAVFSIAIVILVSSGDCLGAICTGSVWPGDVNQDCYVDFQDFCVLAENWQSTVAPGDPYPSTVDSFLIEAEDCTITVTPGLEGSIAETDILEGRTGVYVCGGNWDVNNKSTGEVRFVIPTSLPDGEYKIKVKYRTGHILDGTNGFAIRIGVTSGVAIENGGAGGYHVYYPEPQYGASQNTWYDAWFAGPQGSGGWFCWVNETTPLPQNVTLTGIDSGELYIDIWDQTGSNYAYAFIDSFEFVRTGIVVEAEGRTIVPGPAPDTATAVVNNVTWTTGPATVVDFAADISTLATRYAKGRVSLRFPQAIPDGDYYLSVRWRKEKSSTSTTYAFALNTLSGQVHESGIVKQNQFHTFYPITPSINSYDYLAGPSFTVGSIYQETPVAEYISVTGVGADSFQVELWDASTYGYDYMRVDHFVLIPITVPGKTIRVEAENCLITATPNPSWPNSVAMVNIDDPSFGNSVTVMTDPNNNGRARGTVNFKFPNAIPDGRYTIGAKYKTGLVHSPGSGGFAFNCKPSVGSDARVIRHGTPCAQGWNIYYPDSECAASSTWYDLFLNKVGFPFKVYAETPLADYYEITDCDAGEFEIDLLDEISLNYDYAVIDYFEFVPKVSSPADISGDGTVDISDLAVLVSQWIYCNDSENSSCVNILCGEIPSVGRTEYKAKQVTDPVTIDGDLSEWSELNHNPEFWCTSDWIKVDKVYTSTVPVNIGDVYLCLKYDPNGDFIYGAVVADEWDGVYGYLDWNTQDDLEIYIQGDPTNDSPLDPLGVWANAQQFVIGLNNDYTTTYKRWGDGILIGQHAGETGDPGIEAAVVSTSLGGYQEKVVYEFKLVPYQNYGGIDGSTTVRTNLQPGSQIGFDIVLAVKDTDPSGFGMLCPNLLTKKAFNVNNYATLICE